MANKKFTTIIGEIEQSIITKNAQVLSRIEEYREAVPVAERMAEEAEEALDEVESAFLAGDDTVTADEYAVAKAASERAAMLAKGSANRVSRAERQVKNTDKQVAEAFVEAVEIAYPGIPVVATFGDGFDKPRENERPLFVVHQREPSLTNPGGYKSAPIVVRYFRTPLLKPVDRRAIEEAARRISTHVDASAPHTSPDDTQDDVRITVRGITSKVPVLASVSSERLRPFANGVAADICRPTLRSDESIVTTRENILFCGALKVKVAAEIESESVDEQGNRTVTLLLTMMYQVLRETQAKVPVVVEEVIDGLNGQFVGNVGRVSSVVKADDKSVPERDVRALTRARSHSALPTDTASIGYEIASARVYRLTCVSRAE